MIKRVLHLSWRLDFRWPCGLRSSRGPSHEWRLGYVDNKGRRIGDRVGEHQESWGKSAGRKQVACVASEQVVSACVGVWSMVMRKLRGLGIIRWAPSE